MKSEKKICAKEGCHLQAVYRSDYCWNHITKKDVWREVIEKDVQNQTEFRTENFQEADLSSLDLTRMVALGCNFTACRITNTSLNEAVLRGSRFVRCVIEGTNLVDSDWQFATLDGTVSFRIAANGANFSRVSARHCSVLFSSLQKATLSHSDWTAVRFVKNDLTEVEANNWFAPMSLFSQVNFSQSNLEFAILGGSKLSAITAHHTIFKRSNLNGVHSIDSDFSHSDFYYARSTAALFERCNLSHTILKRTVFRTAYIIDCDLTNAPVDQAIMDRTRLYHT